MNLGCLVDSVSRNAGGLHESVRRLAQSFPQQHGKTVVFSLEDEHTAEDVHRWQPLPVRTFPPKYFKAWGYAPGLADALLDANLDILLTHGIWKYSSAASLRWHRQTGRPHIIHPHGMLDPWAVQNSRWKKVLAGLLYENQHLRTAACLRALCESEAQSMRAFGLRNPICVIPNGIDLPTLSVKSVEQGADSDERAANSPAPSSRLLAPSFRPPPGQKVLLYLGRLHPKKNLGPLLHAWAALQKDSAAARDWVLAIAGWDQGGYEHELKGLAIKLGLLFPASPLRLDRGESDATLAHPRGEGLGVRAAGEVSNSPFSVSDSPHFNVLFCGPQFNEAKVACYANCDAFILPSLSEGLPMVVLEAWAYAKPVLMTDECNLPEGLTASAALRIGTEAASILEGLRQLVEMSDTERATMGARGRDLMARQFSWPHLGEEMRRVCEWTLGGGTPPASVRLD